MFKFIRRLFFICIVFGIILTGGIMYINDSKPQDSTSYSSLDIKNIAETASISQVMSDIVSDENNYDLLVRCDDVNALVYFDKVSKDISMVSLENSDDFEVLSSETDKYIDFDSNTNYSMDDLEKLKSDFMSGDFSQKYKIVKEVLSTTDTNIKESDLINMYLSYASKN